MSRFELEDEGAPLRVREEKEASLAELIHGPEFNALPPEERRAALRAFANCTGGVLRLVKTMEKVGMKPEDHRDDPPAQVFQMAQRLQAQAREAAKDTERQKQEEAEKQRQRFLETVKNQDVY